MRHEHDKTPFPCTKAGCKRINGKGFFRKRDLIKHMRREHDISEEVETIATGEDIVGKKALSFHSENLHIVHSFGFGMVQAT